ncbi:MAG: AraC family transcriptional regulator [Reyranellaceae bacterium]
MDASVRAATAEALRPFAFDQPLLSGGRHFSTADYHIARRQIERSTQGLFDLSLPSAREFRQYDVRSARLGGTVLSLVKVDSVSGYEIAMMNDPDLVLLHILMRGSAELQQGTMRVEAAPSQMVLLEGMARSRKRWHGPTQQLMVRLSRSHMERIVASETGVGIGEPLEFGGMQVLDLERVPTLWNHVLTVCRDLNDPEPCFEGALGRLAERTLVLLLLNAVPNNYRWALASPSRSAAAPFYVRRVESYIREHAREPITPEDLVAVGGVSARSIYHGFRRFRSTTPMGYLKAVRLDLARAVLSKGRGNGAASVTEAATAAGYSNLSQFSRDYKARFRELPSQTLA